jgi:glycosyltransferase involved in cell wall biosynthesis
MKVALVVPHMFMHRDILPQVIFSPAALAIQLAEGVQQLGASVTLFSPGPVDVSGGVQNVTADLSLFEQELAGRGYGYTELLKKHPATFIALARQVQAELIAGAFARANAGEFDVVHIYTNEEDVALPFAQLCTKPVLFTHHDPFNFLIRYKNTFPKFKGLHWISMSFAQRAGMPADTNWAANIYHGIAKDAFTFQAQPSSENYIAYLGRIIEPKGLHLAIAAVQEYNRAHPAVPLRLKIAGKHYAGHKDAYWSERIEPLLGDPNISYLGFVGDNAGKQELLGGAQAVLVPSLFEEPFGMVSIEALACGTPVIGLDSGAIPEVIEDGLNGYVIAKRQNDSETAVSLCGALKRIGGIDRAACRASFEARFTLERMCREHFDTYIRAAAA